MRGNSVKEIYQSMEGSSFSKLTSSLATKLPANLHFHFIQQPSHDIRQETKLKLEDSSKKQEIKNIKINRIEKHVSPLKLPYSMHVVWEHVGFYDLAPELWRQIHTVLRALKIFLC